jgi:hypothetical protein
MQMKNSKKTKIIRTVPLFLLEHVTSSVLEKHPETVYNIEVEGNHNYFVTNSNILVYNK